MRTLATWLVVCVAACGSSEDGSGASVEPATGGSAGADGGPQGAGGSSGKGGATGSGGAARSGGSTGSGGATGSGGSTVPVTPNDCSATGAVGTWQDITPAPFRAEANLETTTVVVDPTTGTVYASAGNKTNGGNGSLGIFKSTDCGATWSKISAAGCPLETGDVWQLLIDPARPQTLFASNGYGNNPTVYKSADGAVTFTALATDTDHVLGANFVRTISLDPKDGLHVVVSYHELCKAPHTPLCLSETRDGGSTWRQFDGPPVSASALGGDGGGPMVIGGDGILFFQPGSGVFYTGDAGKTWTEHFQHYNYPGNTDPNTPYKAALPITNGEAGLGYVGTHGVYVSFGFTGIFEIAAPFDATALTPSQWKLLTGSPARGVSMIDDGTSLYASDLNDNSGKSYYMAPVGAGTPWTQMAPGGGARGAGTFSFDPTHDLVYSANWGAGLWRLTTK